VKVNGSNPMTDTTNATLMHSGLSALDLISEGRRRATLEVANLKKQIEQLHHELTNATTQVDAFNRVLELLGAPPSRARAVAVDEVDDLLDIDVMPPHTPSHNRTTPDKIARKNPGDARPVLTVYNGGRQQIGALLWRALETFDEGKVITVNDLLARVPVQINRATAKTFLRTRDTEGIIALLPGPSRALRRYKVLAGKTT
jgi:hypothetical protein